MNLIARIKKGGKFSKDDLLEVVLESNGENINIATHSVEKVSGEGVTHGGGSECGTYLHYKSVDRDVDENGIIDYSSVDMSVSQDSVGSSVIRIVARIITQEAQDNFISEADIYKSAADNAGVTSALPNGTDGSFSQTPPEPPTPVVLKTGEITIEWLEDSFV